MDKKEFRKYVRTLRPREVAASGVWERVESLPEYRSAGKVLLFWSLPDEIPTHEFVEHCSRSHTVVLPKVVGDSLELREYAPQWMEEGAFHILEPSASAPLVDPSEIDFAIIPGVAFGRDGGRLGRGRGYYDRLLPELNCMKIGVAFPYQVFDMVPTEPHDERVDGIIC